MIEWLESIEVRTDGLAGAARPLTFYTDGSCLGNPGRGSYAWVLRDRGGLTLAWCAGPRVPMTTNNRMEMGALASALRFAIAHRLEGPLELASDSSYLVQGFNVWATRWLAAGPGRLARVKNLEIWRHLMALRALKGGDGIIVRWVRGHAGEPANVLADLICNRRAAGLPLPPSERIWGVNQPSPRRS